MKKSSKIILIVSLVVNFFSLSQNVFYDIKGVNPIVMEKEILRTLTEKVETPDTISDWQMFTLALMKVESEFDNNAVSSVGAKGYFQMTPIYVEEVNRVYGTNYKFKDVTNFNKAYEIFDLMQKAHNPNYDMKKALELHNGKHEWYNRRVFKEMNNFREYEEMRTKIKSAEL